MSKENRAKRKESAALEARRDSLARILRKFEHAPNAPPYRKTKEELERIEEMLREMKRRPNQVG